MCICNHLINYIRARVYGVTKHFAMRILLSNGELIEEISILFCYSTYWTTMIPIIFMHFTLTLISFICLSLNKFWFSRICVVLNYVFIFWRVEQIQHTVISLKGNKIDFNLYTYPACEWNLTAATKNLRFLSDLITLRDLWYNKHHVRPHFLHHN